MDRARRAEPYSNATIWTREIARNLAGHLDRISKAHSCVDTKSPKTTLLPQFHHTAPLKRHSATSPLKCRPPVVMSPSESRDEAPTELDQPEGISLNESCPIRDDPVGVMKSAPTRKHDKALKKIKAISKRALLEAERQESIALENQRLQDRIAKMKEHIDTQGHDVPMYDSAGSIHKRPAHDYHKRQEQLKILQENQALAKRLKNTKPTLKSKDWERDDQWNQSYLKAQERRRQALQQELSKTLAAPHTALIRVKQLRQLPDENSPLPVSAAEVTVSTSARDFRRRRSNDDVGPEPRRYSTAANHRRIMQLRQERESELPSHMSSSEPQEEMAPSNVVCDGPPDELVRVRFTFSRKGSRSSGFCTPNGVTGAFSPAVELERTLEAMDLEPEQPAPLLDLPLSSRLEEEEARAGEVVFMALQDCIDIIVSNEVARIEREEASTQASSSALVTDNSSKTLGSIVACEEVVAPDKAVLEEEPVSIASKPNSAVVEGETEPECEDINDITPDQPDPTGLYSGAHEPTEDFDDEVGSDKGERSGSFEGEGDPDASDPSRPPDPPEEPSDALDGHDEEQMETSDDYGGDFDDAEERREENDAKDPDPSTQDTPAHPEPTEAPDDEYDDDQQYEPDEEDNPSTQDRYEAQYDDDLEPETSPAPQDPDLDQSYSDDGFTDDA